MIRSLKIDLIHHCNARCHFCPYHGDAGSVTQKRHEPPLMLKLSDIETLVRECESMGITPKFRFSGHGEATIHPDFPDILRIISERGFRTRLITNGLLLKKHAAILADCHTEVIVSIHGREELHDAVIGIQGALKRAESGINELMTRKASVQIGLILTAQNSGYLETIVARYTRYTSKGLGVRIQHNFDAHVRASLQSREVCKTLARVKERFPNVRTVPHLSEMEICSYYGMEPFVLHPHSCTRYADEVEIRADGAVTVCGAVFGSIRNESFLRIVAGDARAAFRATVQNEITSRKGLSSTRCDRCCYNGAP